MYGIFILHVLFDLIMSNSVNKLHFRALVSKMVWKTSNIHITVTLRTVPGMAFL